MIYKDFASMPMLIEVQDLADTLRIGRSKAYKMVQDGTIRALKLGKHYRIPRDAFIRYIAGETQSA